MYRQFRKRYGFGRNRIVLKISDRDTDLYLDRRQRSRADKDLHGCRDCGCPSKLYGLIRSCVDYQRSEFYALLDAHGGRR